MKSLAHPDYKPVLDAAGLTDLERDIVERWGRQSFLMIGRAHGISDAEARRIFDGAWDKLRPHWPKDPW